MKRSFCSTLLGVLLLISTLFLAACTSNEIAMVENIVKFAEAMIPAIPSLSPAEATQVTGYVDSALSITNDVLDNPNAAGAAKAVADFGALTVPQLTGNSSATQPLQSLTAAVSNFVASFSSPQPIPGPVHVAGANALVDPGKPKKSFSLTDKDEKKRQELKRRIQAARDKLKK